MVSSETLPMNDGRARSIVLTFEIHICWNVLKRGRGGKNKIDPQTAPSAVSQVEQP